MGVGFQSPKSNREWVEEQAYQYEIWQDLHRQLALHYGAVESADAFAPDRVTILLDAEGRAVGEYRPVRSIGDHPGQVLEDCRALFGE